MKFLTSYRFSHILFASLYLLPILSHSDYRDHFRIARALSAATSATITARPSSNATVSSSVPASASSSIPSLSVTSTFVASSTQVASHAASPTPTGPQPAAPVTLTDDLLTLHDRRLSDIVGGIEESDVEEIPTWISSQTVNGTWRDVDYTTGCNAIRTNWPAEDHWIRILALSAAWHGGLTEADTSYVKSDQVKAVISKAMDWWYANDITNKACLDQGGSDACPCTDTTLWDGNWFSNIILVPNLVSQSCLLFQEGLTQPQMDKCVEITARSYQKFYEPIATVKTGLTGANALDVARIGIDLSILQGNETLGADAYSKVHNEMQIYNGTTQDGVHPDGSFGQHSGIIYTGNYGKDYATDIVDLEREAADTSYTASSSPRNTLSTFFEGTAWMIYRNIKTNVLHYDFSVLGRILTFPVVDEQATWNIQFNLTSVEELGQKWNAPAITNFATSLSASSSSANAGDLVGNRMFYNSDYMVHRGSNYVTTLRMFSTRTLNSECTNSQNPFGFHLADGTVYTYLDGDEYEDIQAAWDWNKIPGTTTDDSTPLTCDTVKWAGLWPFVGGASDGNIGVAAMHYTNPATKVLSWQKAWFFLDGDVQYVMVNNISYTGSSTVNSVLDQRIHSGDVFVDGKQRTSTGTDATTHAGAKTLWHGNVGYVFDSKNSALLSIQTGDKTGNWSAIGASTQPQPTDDLYAAWLSHQTLSSPLAYTVFPGVSQSNFQTMQKQISISALSNNNQVSAIYDKTHQTIMAVFWQPGNLQFNINGNRMTSKISTTGNIALVYNISSGAVTVSDPSQNLTSVQVSFSIVQAPKSWGKTLTFTLPTGGLAGSSTTQKLF